MTVLFLRRVGNSLYPEGDESICEMELLPFDKTFKAELRQPRNPRFHRLFFALCHRIASGVGSDAETIASVFKFATGHVEVVKTKSYGDVKVAKSISFAKLDDIKFREFFNRCIQVAFEEWGLESNAFADLLDPKTEQR